MPTTTIDGFRHFYEDEGQGEVLVMVHGAAGSAQSFREVIPHLSPRFRVIAPDLRGLGRSDHVAEVPAKAWVQDVLALADELGIGRFHIYGRSLGSRVAMRTAIDHPERVQTLTVDGALIAVEAAGEARLADQFQSEPDPQRAKQYEQWHGSDWRTVVANYGRIRSNAELQAYLTVRPELHKIGCPTLVMRGDQDDPVHPLSQTLEVHQKVPGSWLWIAPNTGFGVLMKPAWHGPFADIFGQFLSQAPVAVRS